MRTMLLSKAEKSRRTSSRHWRRSSSCFCFSNSWAAAASSAAEASGGGVGGRMIGANIRELGVKRRLVMRLKGFSSTFRSRDLWRVSVGCISRLLRVVEMDGNCSGYLLPPVRAERSYPCSR